MTDVNEAPVAQEDANVTTDEDTVLNGSVTAEDVDAAFAGKGQAALHMIGAPFQIKVWEALMQIPSGHVTTYSEIAQAIGHRSGHVRRDPDRITVWSLIGDKQEIG